MINMEFKIGFLWVLHARCDYIFDARVAKPLIWLKTIVQNNILVAIEKIVILNWNINFLNAIFSVNFEMKYFKDNEIIYEGLFIISKYCPISNSNVNAVVIDMNSVESSMDSDSSNEVYNINKYNNRNDIVNNNNRISDRENRIIN